MIQKTTWNLGVADQQLTKKLKLNNNTRKIAFQNIHLFEGSDREKYEFAQNIA